MYRDIGDMSLRHVSNMYFVTLKKTRLLGTFPAKATIFNQIQNIIRFAPGKEYDVNVKTRSLYNQIKSVRASIDVDTTTQCV